MALDPVEEVLVALDVEAEAFHLVEVSAAVALEAEVVVLVGEALVVAELGGHGSSYI